MQVNVQLREFSIEENFKIAITKMKDPLLSSSGTMYTVM